MIVKKRKTLNFTSFGLEGVSDLYAFIPSKQLYELMPWRSELRIGYREKTHR